VCGVHQGTDWDRVVQIAKMFADIAKFAELKQSFQSRKSSVHFFSEATTLHTQRDIIRDVSLVLLPQLQH